MSHEATVKEDWMSSYRVNGAARTAAQSAEGAVKEDRMSSYRVNGAARTAAQ